VFSCGVVGAGASLYRGALMSVLIVEDDVLVASALSRAVARHSVVQTVGTVRDALEILQRPRHWLAAIVDVGLPDGTGMEVASRLLSPELHVPTLVLTGRSDHRLANEAQALGAQFLFKPVSLDEIDGFLERVMANDPKTRIGASLDALASAAGLTAREREIVSQILKGTARSDLAKVMQTRESTVKTHVRSILVKTAARDLGEVARRILEQAVHRS